MHLFSTKNAFDISAIKLLEVFVHWFQVSTTMKVQLSLTTTVDPINCHTMVDIQLFQIKHSNLLSDTPRNTLC